jgi:putative hemolysin
MLSTNIIILGVLLILSGFFSGIETAFTSVTKLKVETLVRNKKKLSKLLKHLKERPHKLLITILIGNNIVNIGAASLATVVFTDIFGSSGVGIATGIMTFLILVFGEITPKTIATQHSVKISLITSPIVYVLMIILTPLVFIFELITKAANAIFGSSNQQNLSQDEIKTMLTMGKKEGVLDKEAA